jgi:RHS repeat-associated protein
LGWSLSVPSITRKTDKGLPRYAADPEDVFVLSGTEDLVPVLAEHAGDWQARPVRRSVDGREYLVQAYRPRVEGLFARIERWDEPATGDVHWRSITRDNLTTLYGISPESRITDPADPTRVFSWLICDSYDDIGNAIRYEYKAEDSNGVDTGCRHERNRSVVGRAANRYLKRIRYGNRVSRLVQPDLAKAEWLFEVVLDYGEHDPDRPTPQEVAPWVHRADPFSTYRAGFELRTYRLCQRVLMFHHFPDQEEVRADCLVRSTDLIYRGDPRLGEPTLTVLAEVVQRGYRRLPEGGYRSAALPPLELAYREPFLDPRVRTVDPVSLENAPAGVDGISYRWVDLDGEGVSGILTEQAGGWFYKPSLGQGKFGPVREVAPLPAVAVAAAGGSTGAAPGDRRAPRPQLADMDGDGRLDLLEVGGAAPGYYLRDDQGAWTNFVPFPHRPDISWDNPRMRVVDLTGDGLPDLLITDDDVFTWYPGEGAAGFGPAGRTYPGFDEERGPRLVYAEPTDAMYLADMSGDGLADLVRIRNGDVCYWPSLGYGRFGAKIAMDGSPWLDEPDQLDQRRVRLADIDGSGTTDLIYLHRDGVRLYSNQAGNSFGPARMLDQRFPRTDTLSQVATVDLLGQGTACLVWSGALPSDTGRPIRYVDLMGGEKPHLLVGIRNNLGAETILRYAPSTRFYLADKAAGRPWLTRLPFPVHVVERVETLDRISDNRFVTRYVYHHGFYDGVEREFHGFGSVEQYDSEDFDVLCAAGDAANVDRGTHLPPVMTKSWFHTGAFVEAGRISRGFEDEYYRDDADLLLPDTALPTTLRRAGRDPVPWRLDVEEAREACRALKGSLLRQEVYALDGHEAAGRPYTVTERNYTVELLQPRQPESRFGVFFVHPAETISASYERMLYDVGGRRVPDPRVAHEAVLAVDDYGTVLRSASVAYGRRHPDPDPLLSEGDRAEMKRLRALYTETSVTNAVEDPEAFRAPRLAESRTWELRRIEPRGQCFTQSELLALTGEPLLELPYGDWDGAADMADGGSGSPARRLLEHSRVFYRRDDLAGQLALGQMQSRAVPWETLRLVLPDQLVAALFGNRATAEMFEVAGYRHVDGAWWAPSGQVRYAPEPGVDAAAELARARRHFFRPVRFLDPFGAATTVTYDDVDLLILEIEDALGNRVTAGERGVNGDVAVGGNDYRVLAPRLLMDANRNRVSVSYDARGLAVGTARMGKPEEHLGDSLEGFEPDLDDADLLGYLDSPLDRPHRLLGRATWRVVYDPFAYLRSRSRQQPQPVTTATVVRESHEHDLPPGGRSLLQHGFLYSDGFGREIQRRAQAGPVETAGQQWISTGWTVFNNKGAPVRRYEPFFSTTHRFERDRTAGVSSVLCYDPIGRAVATLHPDGTWEKTRHDPWRRASWDPSDTVLDDPRTDPDVGGQVARVLAAEPGWPHWYLDRVAGKLGDDAAAAAAKAGAHARTPALTWLDAAARPLITALHNRLEGRDDWHMTRIRTDAEGNVREQRDALGRLVGRYDYTMIGASVHRATLDSGERWLLPDAVGNPALRWDSRGFRHRVEFDLLRRPVRMQVTGTNAGHPDRELVVERTEYGETLPDAEARNLRTRRFRSYDSSGITTTEAYDFKGNELSTRRQLVADPRGPADWSAEIVLQEESFTSATGYDALDRPVVSTAPDGSELRPRYDLANHLQALQGSLRGPDGKVTQVQFVADASYNARGQRLSLTRGNGSRTRYHYDPLTFRLVEMRSTRGNVPVQALSYTYDPVGNMSHVRDDAQQDVFFRNRRVDPHLDYTYDALYRLVVATGREHVAHGVAAPTARIVRPFPLPADGRALARYVERYGYDAAGNLVEVAHRSCDPAAPGWTRQYRYDDPSPLESDRNSNRLTGAGSPEDPPQRMRYDAHGNLTAMPDLPVARWDHDDRLHATARQAVNDGTGETVFYGYDATGQRTRKATERAARRGQDPTLRRERIYLGAFEVDREWSASGDLVLERRTLHVLDDRQRVALAETRTAGQDRGPARLVRYPLTDHLGSATVELDAQARLITYEEYYPYGGTAYHAARSRSATPKRYRFTGKERDGETGLYYFNARYYLPGLGRWISCDPAGLRTGLNPYVYCRDNPVNNHDPDGEDGFWHNAWEVTKGVGEGVGNLAKGVGNLVAHPINTASAIGSSMAKAYREDGGGFWGVLSAANQLNPAYHAMVAGYETYQAYQRGDYRSMGREGFNTVFQTASTVAVAVGGAGLVSSRLGLGGAAGEAGAMADTASVLSRTAPAADIATATDVAATTVRTGSTLSRTAPQIIRTGSEADLIAVKQLTGTPTGKALTFSVTEDAAESSISLGYRFRTWNEMGHNLVGVTTEGQTSWFHLNAPKGGTGVFTLADPLGEAMLTTTVRVSPQAAARALSLAESGLGIGRVPWTTTGYNCATTVRALLGEAGVATPFWARTPLLLQTGLRYGPLINGTGLVLAGESLSAVQAQQSQNDRRR